MSCGTFTMMAVLAVFVAAYACNPTTSSGFLALVEASPAPPQKCVTDFGCPEGMFCRDVKICGACANCTNVYRESPINCAKGTTECGKCLPGYKEVGGHCSDEEYKEGMSSEELGALVKNKAQPKKEENEEDYVNYGLAWVLAILTIGLLFAIIFVILKYSPCLRGKLFERQRNPSGSGERGELSISDNVVGSHNPSAPLLPEEYLPPPPSYDASENVPNKGKEQVAFSKQANKVLDLFNHHRHFQPPPVRYVVQSATCQQAAPFNIGNGAGEWAAAVPDFDEEQDEIAVGQPQVPNQNNLVLDPQGDEVFQFDPQQGMLEIPADQQLANDVDDENVLGQVDLEEVMDIGEIRDIEAEGPGLEHPMCGDDIYLDFSFSFAVALQPAGRIRSASARNGGLAMDDTHLNINDILAFANFSNVSQASSSMSMALSSDSGTGTSNEDDLNPDGSSIVPSSTDFDIESERNAQVYEDSGLYGDDFVVLDEDDLEGLPVPLEE